MKLFFNLSPQKESNLFEKAVRVAHHLLEHLAVLLEDGYQRAVVDARDLLHRRADLADAGAQHLVGGLGRFERQQGLFGLLFQSGRLEVAADEQPGAERREGRHGDPAAPQQQGCHGQCDEESSERRDEEFEAKYLDPNYQPSKVLPRHPSNRAKRPLHRVPAR